MKRVAVAWFAVIFLALEVCPVFGDINVVARADLLKVKIAFEGSTYSEEIIFEDGKAVCQGYGNFYLAFYNEKALKDLVQSDSVRVFLAPREEGITPPFGNLYLVLKNIFGSVGTENYGLEAGTFYVWRVKFPTAETEPEDPGGMICYKGIAPFGDMAINNIKKNGKRITKNFFAPFRAGK